MTRADLEKHLSREGAKIGNYAVDFYPAVKGKYGKIKKDPYYHVHIAFQDGFSQYFQSLEEVLACIPPGETKTIEEMLADATSLRYPLC